MGLCRELDLAVLAGICITAQEGAIDVMMLPYDMLDDLAVSAFQFTGILSIGLAPRSRVRVAFTTTRETKVATVLQDKNTPRLQQQYDENLSMEFHETECINIGALQRHNPRD